MNPSNPEMGANPEQRVREELVHDIVAASEGTVGLYTSMNLSPEEKRNMVTAQTERGATPSERLQSHDSGGWGDYGEAPIDNQLGEMSRDGSTREQVIFKPEDDGTVKIAYGFSGRGLSYRDDTGRPGKDLMVQFSLPAEKAQSLKDALEGDPSFINQVVEAQTTAAGLSKERWQPGPTSLKPHYVEGFNTTVQEQDRVLKVSTMDTTGQITSAEELTYGTNRSIMEKAQAPEQAPQPTSEQGGEQTNPYTEKYAAYDKTFNEAFAAQRENGVSDSSLLEGLKAVHAQKMERIQTKEPISQQEVDELDIYLDVVEAHMKEIEGRIQGQAQKTEAIVGAREAVESAHNAQTSEYNLPEGTTLVEEYNDAPGNKWLVVKDSSGNQRQIRADKLI